MPRIKKIKRPEPHWLIGVIDSYGAVHLKCLFWEDHPKQSLNHDAYWPAIFHKRWRFVVRNWNIEKSIISEGDFTAEDYDAIQTAIRRVVTPPAWVLENDAWDAAGRPHGKAYDRWLAAYEKKTRRPRRKR